MRMTEDAQDIVLKLQQQIDDACKSAENLENEFSWKIVEIEKNRQNRQNRPKITKEDEDVIQSHKDDSCEGLKNAKKIREVLEIARTLAYENFKK